MCHPSSRSVLSTFLPVRAPAPPAGGGSTNPTQTEIDSWIARGSYTAGSVILNRATAYNTTESLGATGVTPVTALVKTDSFSAHFSRIGGADLGKILRGELPPGFPNLFPAPGDCFVYTLAALINPFPNITSVGLDAGPQITSNGPNGTQLALRQSIQVSGFTYNALSVPNTYLNPGRYSLGGSGGADVGPFAGSLDIVPDLLVSNNPDEFKLINRSAGTSIRWTGGEPSTVLTITGRSAAVNSQTGSVSGTIFVCIQNVSVGQFTVPASILSQLPASQITSAGGFNLVIRGSLSVTAAGKGARFSAPSGLDILTAFNHWNWSFTPQYQ